ncbi:MAG: response regulator [Neorhizobium sp.]|jgi:PAS domain S-box-containing protein|nr:response regulator [Neorhizobium sp.]
MTQQPVSFQWPIGGGETGERIRQFDWAATSLGPIDQWPQHLRIKVNSIVNSPIPQVLMWGADHVMLYNDGYVDIAGNYHPRALGATVPGIWPEIWDWNSRILAAGFRGEVQSFRDQTMTLRRNGEPEDVVFDLFYTPIYSHEGRIDGVLCTVLENTEKVRAVADLARSREELSRSNDRFRAAVDAIHGVLWTNSADGRMVGEQTGWAKLTGQSQDEYQAYGWSNAVHPDDRGASVLSWQDSVAAKSTYVHEHRVRRHDDEYRTFAIRAVPILTAGGEIDEWVGVHTDITEQRAAEAALQDHAANLERQVRHRLRAEEQLRQLNEGLEARVETEIAERRHAERALQQAQKMESIGQLTGGVAHDFNNLLQVVSGNLQLLSKHVAGNERAEQHVANALAGVNRGAKLASQLLAFGRRQALEPRVINIGRLIAGMDDLLRRSLGEAVEVETIAGGGLWNTYADPTQVENVLLNLSINARDAMEGSGRLTIEVGNAFLDQDYARSHAEVEPGQYVMLAVTDTGSGMTPQVLEKVFEPFFSTKPEGKGTGLGLSMVYGFVKQSGGHVKLYSEIGQGTTVKIYLPRSAADEDREVTIQSGPVVGGTETVLVVEDDEQVRSTVVETLADLGYRVLTAKDAQAGLNVVESGLPIDVIFTDVVMPGPLKSREMARRAKERLPNLAVLFTSGYTENSIVHGGKLDAGVELLSKPYTREALARRLRHVIANQKQIEQAVAVVKPAPLRMPVTPAPADTRLTVLLVEDDALIRSNTAEMLCELGHDVIEAGSAGEALAVIEAEAVTVLVTDLGLPDMNGGELARHALALQPSLALVFATGETHLPSGSPDVAVLLRKPYDEVALKGAVDTAIHRRSLD